jgi:hypothetical protein
MPACTAGYDWLCFVARADLPKPNTAVRFAPHQRGVGVLIFHTCHDDTETRQRFTLATPSKLFAVGRSDPAPDWFAG